MGFGRVLAFAGAASIQAAAAFPELLVAAGGGAERFQSAAGRRTAKAAAALGPTALKLAQIASGRRDLLPGAFVDQLIHLQDQAPALRPEVVRRALDQAYAGQAEAFFEWVDYRPIAAGAVAVVVRGQTRDGQDVAIKVVRPGVRRLMEADLSMFQWLLARAAGRPQFAHLPLLDSFRLFADQAKAQCDMYQEAQNALHLRALVGADIVMPEPRLDLTRPSVLVAEFVDGGLRISDPCLGRDRYRSACEILLSALYRMIFTHGFVHLDLHPGNVHVDAMGRVTLYDYGLVAVLDGVSRRRFRDFFLAVANGDARSTTRIVVEAAIRRPEVIDLTAVEADFADLLARRSGQLAGEFFVLGFVSELFALLRRHRLHAGPDFANAIWALTMFEGLVRDRYPELAFQALARPHMVDAILDRMPPTLH